MSRNKNDEFNNRIEDLELLKLLQDSDDDMIIDLIEDGGIPMPKRNRQKQKTTHMGHIKGKKAKGRNDWNYL